MWVVDLYSVGALPLTFSPGEPVCEAQETDMVSFRTSPQTGVGIPRLKGTAYRPAPQKPLPGFESFRGSPQTAVGIPRM